MITGDFYNFVEEISANVKQDSQKHNIDWRNMKRIKINKDKLFVMTFSEIFFMKSTNKL